MVLFGGAGHSREIIKRLSNNGMLIGIDRDDDALKAAKENLKEFSNVKFIKGNHDDIVQILNDIGIEKVDGILLDLGVSSYQLDERNRGFSYLGENELDMRMDRTQNLTAKDVVNKYREEELADIIYKYGEEKFSRSIAKNICKYRLEKEIETTAELVKIIEKSIPKSKQKDGHPAKRTFQAIRIEVNHELDVIKPALEQATKMLNVGGRVEVITFHSLEDKIVKKYFKELTEVDEKLKGMPNINPKYLPDFKLVVNKAIIPSQEELENNNRSRSAKLRIIERIK